MTSVPRPPSEVVVLADDVLVQHPAPALERATQQEKVKAE
jgi:hypothetical protein